MSDLFYRAFEDRFRGSRELIIQRLGVYRPFLDALYEIYPESETLDLGCGRGEWVELLRDRGFVSRGVDEDVEMFADCEALGLQITLGDAISVLGVEADESKSLISAFHLVEHIPFEKLCVLISESLRVLKPGGFLIMETPNPENLTVASTTFHLDPTHRVPIPPALLSFLPEYYGFSRVKILRLQEAAGLLEKVQPSLADVLRGVSPDYAVIAQKACGEQISEYFNEAFKGSYGISAYELEDRYDEGMDRRLGALEQDLKGLKRDTGVLEASLDSTVQEIMEVKQTLDLMRQDLSGLSHAVSRLWREYQAIYLSKSWRITAPLRWIAGLVRSLYRKK